MNKEQKTFTITKKEEYSGLIKKEELYSVINEVVVGVVALGIVAFGTITNLMQSAPELKLVGMGLGALIESCAVINLVDKVSKKAKLEGLKERLEYDLKMDELAKEPEASVKEEQGRSI